MPQLSHWQIAAALLLAFSITGLALSFAGAIWPVFDVFVHFAAHFVGFGVLALLALWFRRGSWAVLLLGSLTVLAAPLLPGLVSKLGNVSAHAKVQASAADHPLRILSFNVYFLNNDLTSLEQAIRRADADIVLLYEFQWAKLPVLEALKDIYPYQKHCADARIDIYNAPCEVAILSKRHWNAVHITMPGANMVRTDFDWVRAEFDWDDRHFTVIGVHLARPQFNRKGPLGLPWPDSVMQHRQIERLAVLCKKTQGNLILAGDFNATPWSHVIRRLQHKTGLHHAGMWLASWPVQPLPLPQFPIDQFFVSPGVTVEHVRLGEAGGSDHFSVIGEFSF